MNPLALAKLFALDDAAFRARFRDTPLWRPKRRGMLRNAAIVLGNQRTPAGLAALVRGLHDEEPIVRSACAWALGEFRDESARAALGQRRNGEGDAAVQAEIDAALAVSTAPDPSPR
jgi:epoxyqueuosine reductase